MKIAYLDCFSGISGDMLLGALLDCGLDAELLRGQLAGLDLDPWEMQVSRLTRQGIGATAVQIIAPAGRSLRTLPDLTAILETSRLDPAVIRRSLQVLTRLAHAEARVHDLPVDRVHFHEIGAIDTIIDVVGTVVGLQLLGINAVHCSPLPLGRGFVNCAHGSLPLPAPAVCELLGDIPVCGIEAERELVTPTGAALVAELVDRFGPLPAMRLSRTGYGAGQAEGEAQRPNLLRVMIGQAQTVGEAAEVEVIETHLDDWHSEGFPLLCDRLFAHQALDVSLTPMQMKKGRPGFCLRVIAAPVHAARLKELILSETSSIGLRFRTEQRLTLPRRAVTVATRWGAVAAKEVDTPIGSKIYPEYEACRVVAEQHQVPLDLVYREVLLRSEQGD
ncbi:MAG: nickel pincer cofactor biosynthesis protein LarC [Desulfofustis sp.]|nr:nickel pincer cofactor biosynthesis protein LarC [Desulfofustis sp.]